MGYITTDTVHHTIRHLFGRQKSITIQEVVDERLKNEADSISHADAVAQEEGDHETRVNQHMLACEVVLGKLIQAGCVYPTSWSSCLEYVCDVADSCAETEPPEDTTELRDQAATIRSALKDWHHSAPPWVDQGPQQIQLNKGWLICIEEIISQTMDAVWESFPKTPGLEFMAGRTFTEHPIIEGEDL